MTSHRAVVARLVVFALALATAGACQVTTVVGVDARADGSGTVSVAVGLDRDAVSRAGGLRERLRVSDLRSAGWTVRGPTRERDGYTWIRAVHSFSAVDELQPLVDQVAGAGGPLRDFRLSRRRSLFRTHTGSSGTVDLTAGLGSIGDESLRRALGGTAAGVTAAELQRQLGAALDRVFNVKVALRLPGTRRSWEPPLGTRAVLVASGTTLDRRRVVLTVVAVTAAIALGAVLVHRRRRAPSPAHLHGRAPSA